MDTNRTIRRVSAETGLSADTLRYYERIGILPDIARSDSGHRRFSDGDIGWIKLVQCLRATGMPIEQLHEYAVLMQQGDATAQDRRRILEDHRRRIKDEMRALKQALELVEQKIAGYNALVPGRVTDPPAGRPTLSQVRVRPT
jgi:MerR family transcriptional regulator, aldehyde-responsive regulator